GDSDLVVPRGLPGDAAKARLVPFATTAVVVERPIHPRCPYHHFGCRVRRRQELVLGLVPVGARILTGEPPAANGAKEPELIFLDRPANRPGVVEELLRPGRGRQTSILEGLVEVVALQAVVGKETGNRGLERVAAFLRDDIDDDA